MLSYLFELGLLKTISLSSIFQRRLDNVFISHCRSDTKHCTAFGDALPAKDHEVQASSQMCGAALPVPNSLACLIALLPVNPHVPRSDWLCRRGGVTGSLDGPDLSPSSVSSAADGWVERCSAPMLVATRVSEQAVEERGWVLSSQGQAQSWGFVSPALTAAWQRSS